MVVHYNQPLCTPDVCLEGLGGVTDSPPQLPQSSRMLVPPPHSKSSQPSPQHWFQLLLPETFTWKWTGTTRKPYSLLGIHRGPHISLPWVFGSAAGGTVPPEGGIQPVGLMGGESRRNEFVIH